LPAKGARWTGRRPAPEKARPSGLNLSGAKARQGREEVPSRTRSNFESPLRAGTRANRGRPRVVMNRVFSGYYPSDRPAAPLYQKPRTAIYRVPSFHLRRATAFWTHRHRTRRSWTAAPQRIAHETLRRQAVAPLRSPRRRTTTRPTCTLTGLAAPNAQETPRSGLHHFYRPRANGATARTSLPWGQRRGPYTGGNAAAKM